MNAKELAGSNLILLATQGSQLFGTATEDSDIDQIGVCIEPPEYVIGNQRFEQWEFSGRSDTQIRAGKGEKEGKIYSLRKFMRLALNGNPTILTLLYTPDKFIEVDTPLGQEMRAMAPALASRRACAAFLGYLHAQRERMDGSRGGKHTNRPELVEKWGYDLKYASHMIRLGLQGVEFMRTGTITLPIAEPHLTRLREIREGKSTKEGCLEWAKELEETLRSEKHNSPLPEHPDTKSIDEWLISAHMRHWCWANNGL